MRRLGGSTFLVLAAGSFVFSSTAATAARPDLQADPFAVIGLMSSGGSAAALCGAAAAAAAAVQPASGCVLPQIDVAPAAVPSAPPPPVAVPVAATGGVGISPLLLGLAAVAAGVALYLVLHHNHHNNQPNSPA